MTYEKGNKVFISRDRQGDPLIKPRERTLEKSLGNGFWTLVEETFTEDEIHYAGDIGLEEYERAFLERDFFPDYLSALSYNIMEAVGTRDFYLSMAEMTNNILSPMVLEKERLLSEGRDKILVSPLETHE